MQLNYKSFGQGPALIILHGLFGSLDNWVSHARSLSEDYSVYILDQRNHGKSPHAPDWDYDIMAEDLAEFMDQHGIMQAHLLGHSMGGKTVIAFANLYPERIDKLIVADMGMKAYPPHHNQILESLAQFDLHKMESRQAANEALAKGIADPVIRQFLLKSLGRDDQKAFRWKFNLSVILEKYFNILASVTMEDPFEGPCLFLHGELSDYVLPKDQDNIRSAFPGAEFKAIPEAGHWLHADQPQAFLAAVRRFLAD
ncbi:MAG: alpha/beta fold hydrolase [Bacteroidota bacterium]